MKILFPFAKERVMDLEQGLEKLVELKNVESCKNCQGKMQYMGSGRYRCNSCGNERLDDFGIIKQYLEQNGPTPKYMIAQQTGISMAKIDSYLKKGMVEVHGKKS